MNAEQAKALDMARIKFATMCNIALNRIIFPSEIPAHCNARNDNERKSDNE
jgi:hypothetical protein